MGIVCKRLGFSFSSKIMFVVLRSRGRPLEASPGLVSVLLTLSLTAGVANARSDELTPPYFNLAENRTIRASATCGEDTEGPELYCKLIGANAENDVNVNLIHGQFCDYCDPSRPDKRHPPEYAVDGMETWWQSPPLSRGMKYNEVNLTIDFGQEFHVAYIFIRMGISPRPGLWILEKSADYGKTWTPWQYFSDSESDCETYFGKETLRPITSDDSVICTTEYSKIVPLEGGEIPISILNNRPSARDYFNSPVLQEWTRATNVRFRFLRTKNLLGHLMFVARQDPTVTRRYFYSIKDISIGGRCMCNGHADVCEVTDPNDPNILLCRCQHNTCGPKCERCCPGFEQKAWQISKNYAPFSCEPCNCFQHSNECVYDPEVDRKRLSLDIYGKYEGGGVCQNCQHNTMGINCNQCQPTFYRPYNKHWNETDVCQPCNCNYFYSTGNCEEGTARCECKPEYQAPNCDRCSYGYYGYPDCIPCGCFLNGTESLQCEPVQGHCSCKYNFGGKYCKECADSYFNFPTCEPCGCNALGSISDTCDQNTGNCTCKSNYGGLKCDQCENGYFSYPSCTYCNCDIKGTEAEICDKNTGKCLCKEGYGGERCDQCIPGYFGYPECKPCNCSVIGSASSVCDVSGTCPCLPNFGGRTCEQCRVGYYSYPECLACNCDGHGSIGVSCDNEGRCQCHNNFDGIRCEQCREGFYNFPACEECNCNPAGVVAAFAGCGSVPAGELCQCKERVEGRICDKCKPLYWNLNLNNPEGCSECNCHIPGVLGGFAACDNLDGQCVCKPSVISRSCSECVAGTYDLQEENLFGCKDCGCDIGGSINTVCDKATGQCTCQARVTGRTCKEPIQAHYFPTLYQFQYEVEDGHTPANTAVRYGYDESVFPGYSWKGYAVFSQLQNQILYDVLISKPSLYLIILHYVNPNPETVTGTIRVIPDNPHSLEQTLQVHFKSSSEPAFVTASGATALVMEPGQWTVSIENKKNLFLDYFVLLPEEYSSASILTQKVVEPCTIDDKTLCRDYSYPNVSKFDVTLGNGGMVLRGDKVDPLKDFYGDHEHLIELKVLNRIPLLNKNQSEIAYNITIGKPGPYVLVINYFTPKGDHRTQTVNVESRAQNGVTRGRALLYSCPYTMVCRQIVTDKKNTLAIQNVDGNVINVILQGADDANIGVQSIVAIPYDEWSLDYIKPRPVCILKDGNCISSRYPTPPESKKVQFELDADVEGNVTRPVHKISNDSSYIYLEPSDNMIDLHAKVPVPGYYSFVVQYYQPDNPEFNLNVIVQNGQFYEAKLAVEHCPSKSGCRAVVKQADGNPFFSLTENFMITLKAPNHKGVYLDYLLIVPADLYSENVLEEEDLDRTAEFISTCASNHFYINTSDEGFCKDSVFSITAGYNNGALQCYCDHIGSLSFQCNKFGGQCECKPNVIGRQCEACKTGFYDFPDCKPCNCPLTALCEASTGRCICPPHVTGERCDQCMPFTYGFDPIIGCEECKCNPLGVEHNYLQCDLFNGSCTCKNNVVGRTCSVCQAGYFAFPYCERCDCNYAGTLPDICDQVSAECLCKKNAVGPDCSLCREGSYNLQADNEDGCTDCFCFGKTSRCTSSNYVQSMIIDMQDWGLVEINETETSSFDVTLLNSTVYQGNAPTDIGVDLSQDDMKDKRVYFSAPSAYLGKKLTLYGSRLNYSIFYTIGSSGKAVSGADVILAGAGTHLAYMSVEQPAVATDYSESLGIVESNFELPSGIAAKREHIMTVLNNLTGLYIRATYWSNTVTARLSNVLLVNGVPYNYTAMHGKIVQPASSVEQCQCPPGYQGLSCEDCAPGYYRISTGPHGGYCVPCQCNGHADECDVHTGLCFNCKHNTRGDHCEQCDVGYHGNALQGTPMDCLICACPLPVASNNFATACDLSSDGEKISCDCVEGYFGARCQSCAPGYYGKPEVVGDFCKPCDCSGNIDPTDPYSCNTVTGECLHCLNNTFGNSCALCAPDYYGDAITAKNCQPCDCDNYGRERCDSHTGQCICKPNVEGEKCDRCVAEHYGFQSGQGCIPCNCSPASLSAQCHDQTGQCQCKPGVTGRNCDRCTAGYWNFTSDGCISCGCKSEYSLGFGCNAETGQCECLPGVTGEKCDHCPHRWAFVDGVGCHSCDSCTHDLLDDTDALAALIDPIIIEFNAVDSGYFTTRRLTHLNDTLNELKPKVGKLQPNQINLSPVLGDLDKLETDVNSFNRKVLYAMENSAVLADNAHNISLETDKVFDEISDAVVDAKYAVNYIESLSDSLISGEDKKVDAALEEASKLLDEINIFNLSGRANEADKQYLKADNLLEKLRNLKKPVDNIDDKAKMFKTNLTTINNKLDDLANHTQFTFNTVLEVEKLLSKNRRNKDSVERKLDTIHTQTNDVEKNLKDSDVLLKNASEVLDNFKELIDGFPANPKELEKSNLDFDNTLENNINQLVIVKDLVPVVKDHAQNLTLRAQELDNLLTETRDLSENAVNAANAYKNIVEEIKNARDAAVSGKSAAENAADILNNISNQTIDARNISTVLLEKAQKSHMETSQDLPPELEEAKSRSRPIRSLHEDNEEKLENIRKILNNPIVQPLELNIYQAAKTAEEADTIAQTTLDQATETFKNIANEKTKSEHLPKDLDDTKRNILQVEQQIYTVNQKLPNIVNSLKEFPDQYDSMRGTAQSVEDKIKKLNQQIALARDIANRIKVGVKFYPNTTLELRNPPNLADLSTSTQISGYFKTSNPNGLLLYLGNGNGTKLRRTQTDDYLALEIENGYPVLTLEIGNDPQRIISNKYVADDTWYQFIIDRTGHNAKLSIREEVAGGRDQIYTVEETLNGTMTIFNLDRNLSKLFVGGYPPQFPMQNQVRQNSFDGEMEELVIGDTPISLWNFNDGNENNHGAIERNKLVNLQPSTGYRFNGNGYAIINARLFNLRIRSHIKLSFKTFATEGLLFLAGKEKTFISIELRNGKILYQYNLGDKTKTWYTKDTYNDGKWHTVSASRDGANGNFIVDEEEIPDRSPPVEGSAIEQVETFSFGGYPQFHSFKDVTNTDFDGCIDNVTIMGNLVDLTQNVKAYDVTPGCPVKFSRLVSFSENTNGYIRFGNISSGDIFQLSLKFRTKEPNGLIFYFTNSDQSVGLSLALDEGELHLIDQKIDIIPPDVTFNDNEWHVVTITHNTTVLRLDYDDYAFQSTDSPPPLPRILYGDFYIGGLPRTFAAKQGTVATERNFAGCIGDTTVNGVILNFANSTDKFREVIGKCILDKQIGSDTNIHVVPTLPPVEELDFQTLAPSESFTRNPFIDAIPKRGDGGFESGVHQPEEVVTTTSPATTTTTVATVIPDVRAPRPPGTPPPTIPQLPREPSCALPIEPQYDDTANSGSYRFGSDPESRLEYPEARGKYRKQFDFSLEFKTTETGGILMYVSSIDHKQFAAIILQSGHVVFIFSGGGAPAIIKSPGTYVDNAWHKVEVSRNHGDGKLVIDNEIAATGRAPSNTAKIELSPPYYVGGIRSTDYEHALENLNTTRSLNGCIRDFHMNSKPMEKVKTFGAIPCSENVEPGTFFHQDEGYMKLKERFKVGVTINIKMDIKPRTTSGVLIAVHGKRDYLVLEMVNGTIKVTVENGKGPISNSFRADNPHYLCDGQWHTIQVIKSKSAVTLSVDATHTEPSVGDPHSISTDTGGGLFLGGHRLLHRARGITVRKSFVGCMRSVFINEHPITLSQDMAEGKVSVGFCPTN
ncbi:laminin subunit alpha [Agrilus planipennis]|uniref:Laminin subunit alpha n=1 Tax=Agrilus planipennis TaxID=224129 RepID=A0A1W4WA48_AGRPL|nr:laminin subunit alpha [Agrilus planipennis]